jgi:hypothetical protein
MLGGFPLVTFLDTFKYAPEKENLFFEQPQG